MIFPGEFAACLDPWCSPPIWSASALFWAWGERHWNKLPGGEIFLEFCLDLSLTLFLDLSLTLFLDMAWEWKH